MKKKHYTFTNKVRKFPQAGGWYFVPLHCTYSDLGITQVPKYGLIPATITIRKTTWQKSLLPLGDGTLFVALAAPVRQRERLQEGDEVTLKVVIHQI